MRLAIRQSHIPEHSRPIALPDELEMLGTQHTQEVLDRCGAGDRLVQLDDQPRDPPAERIGLVPAQVHFHPLDVTDERRSIELETIEKVSERHRGNRSVAVTMRIGPAGEVIVARREGKRL